MGRYATVSVLYGTKVDLSNAFPQHEDDSEKLLTFRIENRIYEIISKAAKRFKINEKIINIVCGSDGGIDLANSFVGIEVDIAIETKTGYGVSSIYRLDKLKTLSIIPEEILECIDYILGKLFKNSTPPAAKLEFVIYSDIA